MGKESPFWSLIGLLMVSILYLNKVNSCFIKGCYMLILIKFGLMVLHPKLFKENKKVQTD